LFPFPSCMHLHSAAGTLSRLCLGVSLRPLGFAATDWPLAPPRKVANKFGAVGGMRIGRGNSYKPGLSATSRTTNST
jgi:hypothetical protein